jgi:hypothetical protein
MKISYDNSSHAWTGEHYRAKGITRNKSIMNAKASVDYARGELMIGPKSGDRT